MNQIKEFEMQPCPRCGTKHMHGDYVTWPDGTVAPEDIICDCGLELYVLVPLVKTNYCGWELAVRRTTHPMRLLGD